MRPVLFLGLASLAAGCGFKFERPSEVIDRRILAISAEPPELVSDGSALPKSIDIRALVVDPKAGTSEVAFEWRTCTPGISKFLPGGDPASTQGEPDTVTQRCDPADPATLVSKGTSNIEGFSSSALAFPIPDAAAPLLGAASKRGYALSAYVHAELFVENGELPLYALKRIVMSPAIPAGRVANRNPHLAAVLMDGAVWNADAPIELPFQTCDKDDQSTIPDPNDDEKTVQSCAHLVTPAFDASESEPYTVQQFDGQLANLHERLRFDWYADLGRFTNQSTEQPGGLATDKRDPLSTKWIEPVIRPEGPVSLWVVVRDGRGGTSWVKRTVVFKTP